jgi:hypothetical protein
MRRPFLAFLAGVALALAIPVAAQVLTPYLARTWTATAPSGVNGFALRNNGARLDLGAGASDYLTSDGTTVTFAGPASSAGTITSTVGSGSNAFRVQTNGGRIDFGAGANDYASSDGTTVTFAGPLNLPGGLSTAATISSSVASGFTGLSLTTNGARIDFGAGASDHASSDGTTVTFAGAVGTGSLRVGASGTSISGSFRNTTTQDFATINTDACATDVAVTVTGAAVNGECVVGPPAALSAGFIASCYVSATNTVQLRVCNNGANIDPPSATYSVRVFNP